MDPESPRTEGFVVPCPLREHLVGPWVAPVVVCRSSDEILYHRVQGGMHKHWAPIRHQSCCPRTSTQTDIPTHYLLFGPSIGFDVAHVIVRG